MALVSVFFYVLVVGDFFFLRTSRTVSPLRYKVTKVIYISCQTFDPVCESEGGREGGREGERGWVGIW